MQDSDTSAVRTFVASPTGRQSPSFVRHPGMRDVARLAGVSYQTVSRVMNDHPNVSASTRGRVLAAIDELGYRRNLAARALVTNLSTTLGMVTDGSSRFGPVSTLMALEKAAREEGYASTVVSVKEPYGSSVPVAIHGLEEQGVDGIIVIAPVLEMAAVVRQTASRAPIVMIAAGEASAQGLFAYSENQELGARMATRHLIDLGHTDIAHIAGSANWFDGRVRKRGWESTLREADLVPGICLESDWTPRFGYEAGLRFVTEGVPGAIFVASDHMALGLLRAFAENGIDVPGDVSVVGFDDIEGADYFYPPLTTVRQDFAALAQQTLAVLLRAVGGRATDVPPIAPSLVIRRSTAGA